MKTMCPPGYHHNGYCHKAIVVITGRAHCFQDCNYYVHLASVRFKILRFEDSVSWITYDYLYKYGHK